MHGHEFGIGRALKRAVVISRRRQEIGRELFMIRLGYKLSSEEFGPADLVRFAVRAEAAGFEFALISDHFHPWTDRQGESPFVWTVLGAIANATTRLRVGTAVTCPTIRVHPAIIAQAAATTAALMEGRFSLGLGSGENLNEHIVGRGWPSPDIRLEMLTEAVDVVRLLWEGGNKSFHGRYYTVEDARLYTLPKSTPTLMIAASNPGAAALAGRAGDAMINTEVESTLLRAFTDAGGGGKPRFIEMTVCWAKDERQARKTAHAVWGLAALEGMLFTELPTPALFESALKPISEDAVAEAVVCGPDARQYIKKITEAQQAGYSHVCLHQVGPAQEAFLAFCEREILPAFVRPHAPRARRRSGRASRKRTLANRKRPPRTKAARRPRK
jgi:G6PDH family F420-dependent oxidoreductase